MALAIETRSLTKYFGDQCVVDDINLRVLAGTLHGMIGPNGAGKTTSLEMLCGITKPTSGIARIMGFDIETQPIQAKKIIGYIPENPSLYQSMKIDELFEFIGRLFSVPREFLDSRIEEYVELFELDHRRRYLGSLSRGELQKVLICSLMIREPSVFLLDEPFHSLDPVSAIIFSDLLKKKLESGATVLLATHQLETAEKLCDSFTIIDKGSVIAHGTLNDFSDKIGSKSTLEDAFLHYIKE